MAGLERAYVATQQRIKIKEKALATSGYKARGEFATEDDVKNALDAKLGKMGSTETSGAVPKVGGSYDGKKIVNVKRIR